MYTVSNYCHIVRPTIIIAQLYYCYSGLNMVPSKAAIIFVGVVSDSNDSPWCTGHTFYSSE